MAPVLRQGWELNDPNTSSRQYRATVPVTAVDSSGRSSSNRITVINNLSTGAFDYYEPGLTGLGSPFARYDPTQNKVIPINQSTYDKYFNQNTPTGRSQLTSITNNVKGATFDLAQINTGTDPLNNREFEELKKKSGYQSLANKAKGGQRPAAPGSPTPNPTETPIDAQQTAANDAEIKKQLENIKERPKNTYTPLVIYPEKLRLEYQDCIKFSMLKYEQSFLNRENRLQLGQFSRSVSLNNKRVPTVGDRTIFTTIVLPIPGGINDSNGVDWQGDSLDEISKAFADIAQSTITEGAPGAESAGQRTAAAVGANVGALQKLGAATFTSLAIGKSGIMQRQYGATLNPNLELLFNGPQLRTFSFSFKLSPRSETEAIIVKKIIRYFKQGMTPKRSSGYLLLQSPHTFAISYLTANKEHPYLNKFKECALTQCNVNYTPEGNYMSFDGAERSMTSYELTLQFQELVPLFDDDYSALDSDQDEVIGF